MRLLRSEFDVETRFGGRFVQAIDGAGGRGARAAARLVLLRQRRGVRRRRGRVRALARRPRPVGPPPLGRGHARAGDRRRLPRAVSQRTGGRAAAGARGVRGGSDRALPRGEGRAGATWACRRPGRRSARPAPRPSRGSWWRAGRRRASCAARPRSRRDRRRAACSRASATTAASLELLDAGRRGRAHGPPGRRHRAGGRAAPARRRAALARHRARRGGARGRRGARCEEDRCATRSRSP